MARIPAWVGMVGMCIPLAGCDEFAFSYSERRPVRREVVYVEPPPPRAIIVEERPVHEVHVYEPATEVHVHHGRPVREVHVIEPAPAPRGVRVAPPPPGPNYVWDGKRWKRSGHKHKSPPPPPSSTDSQP